jgi:predicted TIM-barrel fold metal-dependent hydrolase
MFGGFDSIKYSKHLLLLFSFGDKDLQLELANPLHLRAVLEHPNYTQCRVVLLHGSYPFMREASYLASVYPQVRHLF